MKVAIRVDSSVHLGFGHFMRCLALAHALRAQEAEIHFVCRALPDALRGCLAPYGFRLSDLGTSANQQQDSEDPQEFLHAIGAQGGADWVVVDHYGIGLRWERAVRASGSRLLVIDDLGEREHDCDVLLNQNLGSNFEERYQGLLPADCTRLIGPRFALLRQEFADVRAKLRARDGVVRRIAVCFGGSDSSNQTTATLQALASTLSADISVDVLVGALNPNIDDVALRCLEMANAKLHVQSERMVKILGAADLAIGGGGVSALERCCLGLPSIVQTVADNQVPGSRALARCGAALYLGPAGPDAGRSLESAMATLLSSPELVQHISSCASALVDGRGTQRVARTIGAPEVSLRSALAADSSSVYEWRNSEEARSGSFNPAPIALRDHERWYAATLLNGERALLIGSDGEQPVGVLRYDFEGEAAAVSIYLAPGKRGRGYGPALLREGHRWLREHRPGTAKVQAQIRSDNPASRSAFQEAGYDIQGSILTKAMT